MISEIAILVGVTVQRLCCIEHKLFLSIKKLLGVLAPFAECLVQKKWINNVLGNCSFSMCYLPEVGICSVLV